MKIGLIDVDGGKKFPNIALMKISAYHRSRGDLVQWYEPTDLERYDKVYMSKVFSFSPDYPYVPNAHEIVRGGTGYAIELQEGREKFCKEKDVELPYEIEHTYPDYSLYPELTEDTAYGFLTRGCPRGCNFCHVAAKEGKAVRRVANLDEFWNGQKNIVLCDPNILACKDWKVLLQQLIDTGANIDLNQGVDVRLMTPEKAEMLGRIKMTEIHFAWDRYQDRDIVLRGLETYMAHSKKKPPKHNRVVYVLCNFDTTMDQDLDRIYTLRDMGYWAYVMLYDKEHASREYRKMARWCNNRFIFGACKRFEDYWVK